MRKYEYIIGAAENGMEVGRLLRSKGYSRASITRLKYGGGLLLDGKHIRTVDRVREGSILSVIFTEDTDAVPNPGLDAPILYDDDDLVVFNKPAGIPVHRSNGHNDDTLENLFAALFPETAFHAVSRLDRNTSGIVIAAKNKFVASKLMSDEKFRPRKLYYATVPGGFAAKHGMSGEIIAPIARESDSIIKRVVREDGDYACTKYTVAEQNNDITFLELKLVTGRTHQIRVHFSYLGFPLLGDDLYGGDCMLIQRQALHCGRSEFIHPVTNKTLTFSAPLPDDIGSLLK